MRIVRIVRNCLGLISALLLTACAANAPSGPVRSGTEAVTSWMADQSGSTPGKIILMRNNTDATLAITSLTLYECENVRNSCSTQQLAIRLAPGETKEIARVEPQRREQSFRFRYRFGWGPATEGNRQ